MIQSPNFPNIYENNFFRIWDILAPDNSLIKLRIDQLSIQEDADFIYVGDAAHFGINSSKWLRLTGHIQDIWANRYFESTGPSIIIIFTTDGTKRDFGFSIECYALEMDRTKENGIQYFLFILKT